MGASVCTYPLSLAIPYVTFWWTACMPYSERVTMDSPLIGPIDSEILPKSVVTYPPKRVCA